MLENQIPVPPLLVQDLGMMYPKITSKNKIRYGLYECSCGNEFKAITKHIRIGATKSCGCYQKQCITSHGFTKHPLYQTWNGMIQRTSNNKSTYYIYYGGRGITVCDRWKDISNFIEDMYQSYQNGLTLDRINNDGNYEPSNCRWASKKVQSRNTRRIYSNNTSGYRGVSWNKTHKVWQSYICVDSIKKLLGYFNTSLEASNAYNNYVIKNKLEHTINIY